MSHHPKLDSFRQEISQLISENQLTKAIGKLVGLYKSPKGTYYDDLLLLSRQLKDLNDRQMSGLIEDSKANIEKNRITHGLINILSNLESDPVAAKYFGIETKGEVPLPPAQSSTSKSKWPLIISIVVGFIFGYFMISRFLNFSDRNTAENVAPQTEESVQPMTDRTTVQPKHAENQSNTTSTTSTQEQRKAVTPPKANPQTPQENKPNTTISNNTKEEKNTTTNTVDQNLPPPPTESINNSAAKAITIALNDQVSGKLLSSRDQHFYAFTPSFSGKVRILLANQSSGLTPVINVTRPDGVGLLSKSARVGQGIDEIFRVTNGTRCTIRVQGRGTTFGNYSLKLEKQ